MELFSFRFDFFSPLPSPHLCQQYRSVWFSWAKLLSLDNLILQWEAGNNEPVRSFGRKSFNKKERPKIPVVPPATISFAGSEDSATSSTAGSTRGISLQSWGGAWFPKSFLDKKGGQDSMGVPRQVATSSSVIESESRPEEKEDEENRQAAAQLSVDLNSADTSFSPLQQQC